MKGRTKLDIPRYVDKDCVKFLQSISGRKNVNIEKVVTDVRTHDAWISLLGSDAPIFEVAKFVGATINVARRDYSEIRRQRRQFIDKCKKISEKSADLAEAIHDLHQAEYAHDLASQFLGGVTQIDQLLFDSAPKSIPALEQNDPKTYLEAWKAVRYWVCSEVYRANDPAAWQAAATKLRQLQSDFFKSEIDYDEPSAGSQEFLQDAWYLAPNLTDILKRVSEITHSESVISFEFDPEMDATLLSRKSSQKRDYLRALLSRLFLFQFDFLKHFTASKVQLYSMVAQFGTVLLNLDKDDMITEADVRQTLKYVLPYLESEAAEAADEDYDDPRLELIRSWRR